VKRFDDVFSRISGHEIAAAIPHCPAVSEFPTPPSWADMSRALRLVCCAALQSATKNMEVGRSWPHFVDVQSAGQHCMRRNQRSDHKIWSRFRTRSAVILAFNCSGSHILFVGCFCVFQRLPKRSLPKQQLDGSPCRFHQHEVFSFVTNQQRST
jgi:hypothetical protein